MTGSKAGNSTLENACEPAGCAARLLYAALWVPALALKSWPCRPHRRSDRKECPSPSDLAQDTPVEELNNGVSAATDTSCGESGECHDSFESVSAPTCFALPYGV